MYKKARRKFNLRRAFAVSTCWLSRPLASLNYSFFFGRMFDASTRLRRRID